MKYKSRFNPKTCQCRSIS
ncbi:hypothetical protein ERL59_02665 [Chengkuizengella sp. YPA3-1-1]|uniref:Uncharacterized protein n=1 Tax=Chengkuizengella marina TaxID=2507566 RepID=A0A6N9PZL2_9BACL|nr:hypothetical protein [Chengkuizengella marina]